MSVAHGRMLQQGGQARLMHRARAFLGPGPSLLLSWLPCSCCLWPEDGWGPEPSCLQAPSRLCFSLPSPKCRWTSAASWC